MSPILCDVSQSMTSRGVAILLDLRRQFESRKKLCICIYLCIWDNMLKGGETLAEMFFLTLGYYYITFPLLIIYLIPVENILCNFFPRPSMIFSLDLSLTLILSWLIFFPTSPYCFRQNWHAWGHCCLNCPFPRWTNKLWEVLIVVRINQLTG